MERKFYKSWKFWLIIFTVSIIAFFFIMENHLNKSQIAEGWSIAINSVEGAPRDYRKMDIRPRLDGEGMVFAYIGDEGIQLYELDWFGRVERGLFIEEEVGHLRLLEIGLDNRTYHIYLSDRLILEKYDIDIKSFTHGDKLFISETSEQFAVSGQAVIVGDDEITDIIYKDEILETFTDYEDLKRVNILYKDNKILASMDTVKGSGIILLDDEGSHCLQLIGSQEYNLGYIRDIYLEDSLITVISSRYYHTADLPTSFSMWQMNEDEMLKWLEYRESYSLYLEYVRYLEYLEHFKYMEQLEGIEYIEYLEELELQEAFEDLEVLEDLDYIEYLEYLEGLDYFVDLEDLKVLEDFDHMEYLEYFGYSEYLDYLEGLDYFKHFEGLKDLRDLEDLKYSEYMEYLDFLQEVHRQRRPGYRHWHHNRTNLSPIIVNVNLGDAVGEDEKNVDEVEYVLGLVTRQDEDKESILLRPNLQDGIFTNILKFYMTSGNLVDYNRLTRTREYPVGYEYIKGQEGDILIWADRVGDYSKIRLVGNGDQWITYAHNAYEINYEEMFSEVMMSFVASAIWGTIFATIDLLEYIIPIIVFVALLIAFNRVSNIDSEKKEIITFIIVAIGVSSFKFYSTAISNEALTIYGHIFPLVLGSDLVLGTISIVTSLFSLFLINLWYKSNHDLSGYVHTLMYVFFEVYFFIFSIMVFVISAMSKAAVMV